MRRPVNKTREPARSTAAVALSALILGWIVLGPQMLRHLLGDSTLAWIVYGISLALLVVLAVLARRAQRAAQLDSAPIASGGRRDNAT
jgi:hypothetical protein